MGLRDTLISAARDVARTTGLDQQIADGLTRVAKVFGPGVPESFQQGEAASQMTPASPFSPGTPIGPYDGYDRTPRSKDFTTGYNIATRPRLHERVSFEALRGLIEAYDIAQLAMWHRIDSIRSLDWKLVPADDTTGDVSDAIKAGMAALDKPDREHHFDTWFAMWAWDILAYDAGCLARMRNRAGRAVGLRVVSGPTIAPLLDYWGNSPAPEKPGDPEPEAYVQYANGLPWNWLTRSDLIYEPFRQRPDSPYGTAPLEAIILNANTDLRFQLYFLQRFTSGNLPAAFASAPDSWSPDQIEQFQTYWDAMMFGDQAGKHQIKWMPPGSKFEWSNEKDFSDVFSLFLMRKSLAAYHVVPADMGFTENVNRSSGESQADVQHRLGDAPFARYCSRILTGFLQDDLGLPLRHMFDLGEEQDDRVAQAQADQIYVNMGAIGPSEVREMRYGRAEPEGRPVPRYVFSSRQGPIPLSALYSVAGEIDPETGAPVPGSKLPHMAFGGVEGVIPNPPLKLPGLAEQEFGPKAIPAAPPPQPVMGEPVAKEEAPAAPSPGIDSNTGIYGDPLIRGDEDEDDEDREADLARRVKKEMATYRNYRSKWLRRGEWRDFSFYAVDSVTGHNLNDAGRLAVRKAAGEVAVAGLAVRAADTGRVLMIQRALCDDDPAGGKFECPGGHLEQGDGPRAAALREFQEETGLPFPDGEWTGTWTSPDGIYQGFVYTIASESDLDIFGRQLGSDPDGDVDGTETIAWWDPADLPGNPALRAELLADIDAVMTALGSGAASACCGAGCCSGGCCNGSGGCTCAPAEVAKAGGADPKAWPGWELDLRARDYWAPLLAAALSRTLTKARAQQLSALWLAEHTDAEDEDQEQSRADAVEACTTWLASQGLDFTDACASLTPGMLADACLIGAASAAAMTDGQPPDTGGWQPGDQDAARDRVEALGLGATLGSLLARSGETAEQAAAGYMAGVARALLDGTASGLGAAATGASLVAALSDPDTAGRAVLGLLVTGIGAAAVALYLDRKVERVRWVADPASNVCPVCSANEAGSPYKITSAPAWPAHPVCRCSVQPA